MVADFVHRAGTADRAHGGVFNFFGGCAAISVPIAIGYLVQGQSFTPALVMIVLLALMARSRISFWSGG